MESYTVTTEGAEPLTASTVETLVQLRGVTNARGKVTAWGVSFNGVTPTDPPVLVELLYQTTDGTGSAAIEVPDDPNATAALITGFHSFTVEPTAGSVVEPHYVHPQGGNIVREYPPGREKLLDKATTSRLAVRVTPGTLTTTTSAVAFISFEE